MLGPFSFVAFVPVTDLETARAFYGDLLGLRVTEDSPFALVVEAGGTTLRLTRVEELAVQPFTVAGWQVPDVAAAVDALVGRGISFTRYPGLQQDGRGIWTAPDGDRVAWFADPDGNTLSLSSPGRR